MSNLPKLNERKKAAEIMATNPDMSCKQIAAKLKVHENTVLNWRKDPNFVDMVYQTYMVEFGAEIPAVLSSMIREAKAGNVQAGRLVLEHSGKLVKNINVTIDSPFEKFLKGMENAEVVEDEDIIDVAESVDDDFSDLPERVVENQIERTKKENIRNRKAIRDEERKAAYNQKQKLWREWRLRAEKVGIKPLKGRRPTPAQRKEWEQRIIEAENEKN